MSHHLTDIHGHISGPDAVPETVDPVRAAADELADAIEMNKTWEEIDAALAAYRKATG
jgi:hypothetical protein